MFIYDDILSLNTNKIFSNLMVSSIFTIFILRETIIKQFYIKMKQPSETISQFMNDYYIKNASDGILIDTLFIIVYLFSTIKIFNLINNKIKINKFLLLIIINSSVTIFYDLLLGNLFKNYNGDKKVINFFKEYSENAGFHAITCDLIYLNSVLIMFLFFLKYKLNLFYPIMILSIILQIGIFQSDN